MDVLTGIIGQVDVSDVVAWGMGIIAALTSGICFLYEMNRRSTAKQIEYLQDQSDAKDRRIAQLTDQLTEARGHDA